MSWPKTMATKISHKVQEYRPSPPYVGIIPKKNRFFYCFPKEGGRAARLKSQKPFIQKSTIISNRNIELFQIETQLQESKLRNMKLKELKKFKSMKGSVGKEVESQKPFISDPTALHNQHQILEKLLPPSNKLLRNGTNSKVDIFCMKTIFERSKCGCQRALL